MLDDRTEAVLRRLEREYLEAVERGFLGPREGARLRERHIDDALGLATLRPPMPGEQWVDLGSGAGLPGLPLAVAFPASRFTLVDAHRRRVDWVASTTAALHLANVSVVHARLEDYGRSAAREHFDVATARALGPLPVVAELGVPVLRTGGTCHATVRRSKESLKGGETHRSARPRWAHGPIPIETRLDDAAAAGIWDRQASSTDRAGAVRRPSPSDARARGVGLSRRSVTERLTSSGGALRAGGPKAGRRRPCTGACISRRRSRRR